MVIVVFGQHELSLCQCDTFVSGIIGVQAYADERGKGTGVSCIIVRFSVQKGFLSLSIVWAQQLKFLTKDFDLFALFKTFRINQQ